MKNATAGVNITVSALRNGVANIRVFFGHLFGERLRRNLAEDEQEHGHYYRRDRRTLALVYEPDEKHRRPRMTP